MIIAFFAVLLLSVSAYTGRVVRPATGYAAPSFEVQRADSTSVSLADFKGQFLLLNFWDSSDAASRILAAEYENAQRTASLAGTQFCLLSVNHDRSQRLFREIVRADRLTAEKQAHVNPSVAARMFDDYDLRLGNRSYLIDPTGRIVAINPQPATLTALTAKTYTHSAQN